MGFPVNQIVFFKYYIGEIGAPHNRVHLKNMPYFHTSGRKCVILSQCGTCERMALAKNLPERERFNYVT